MPVPSLLLRVLLSLSLVLNGSSYAMASTHMQMGHHESAATTPQQKTDDTVAAADPACHQQHAGGSEPATQAPDTTPDIAPVKSAPPQPDCCKSGACPCACVQQAQAAIPMYSLGDSVMGHADLVIALKPGHAAPGLRHLIRPPIG